MPDLPSSPLRPRPVLWCVSFDGAALSGVVVESLKLADAFRRLGHRVLLDIGYDIKEDKGRFFTPYTDEADCLPDWVELTRVDDLDQVPGYGPELVRTTLAAVRSGGALPAELDEMVNALADRMVTTWRRHGVTSVLVENGTLPENIAYTRALHRAVDRYGPELGSSPFVLWRDHDLMWSSEPSSGKYGTPPYPLTPRPPSSPYIRYLALHEAARRRTREWVPELRDLQVLPNTFDFSPLRPGPDSAGGTAFRRPPP